MIPPNRHLPTLLLIALLLKASYLLVATGANYGFRPLPYDPTDWQPQAPWGAFFLFNHGDTYFYEAVAQHGYPLTTRTALLSTQSVHAFWPMSPLLIRVGMGLAGCSFNEVALVLSLGLSLGAFALAYGWFRQASNATAAFWTTLLLMVAPFQVYFSVFYTEALFLLLTLAGFWLIDQRRWGWLLLVGPALVLTRANGVFACAALLVRLVEQDGWPRTSGQVADRLRRSLYLAPAFLTLIGYLVFLHSRTGDYLAFSTAQAAWGRHTVWPWQTLAEGYQSVTGSFQATYLLVALALAVAGMRRYPLSLHLLVWSGLLLPLLSGLTQSLPRYISVLFPLFLVAGTWLARQSPRLRTGGVLLLLLLHELSLLPWLYDHHAGY
jgi:Gpi18-like mannosyltransferase